MAKKKDKLEKKAGRDSVIKPDKKKKKSEKDSISKIQLSKKAPSPEAEALEEAIRINHDDVCLRAYFIGERRLKEGRVGDSHSDWLEAERQLLAESSRKGTKRKK